MGAGDLGVETDHYEKEKYEKGDQHNSATCSAYIWSS
jgi:hypothetical protein